MTNLFFCYNHQKKADALVRALVARGWQETKDPGAGRFILTDYMLSSDRSRRTANLAEYRRRGIKVFIYPHAARANIFWDFPGQDFPRGESCHFVPASGHVDIMRAYGYPGKIEVVGWYLSRLRPFRPRKRAQNILFGPIHANANGYLSRLDKEINRRAFETLVSLPDVCLTVRYIGDLRSIGLWKAGGVEYIQGAKDLSTQEIDRADLVVSHQTFAYLAVSRGIPTLMMGEAESPRWGGKEEELAFVRSWEKYRDLMAYPLDILAGDPEELISTALAGSEPVREWTERTIGAPFDPNRFVDVLESYL